MKAKNFRVPAILAVIATTLCSSSRGDTELVINNTSKANLQVVVRYGYQCNWIANPEVGSVSEVDGFFDIPAGTQRRVFFNQYAGTDEKLFNVWLRILVNGQWEIEGPSMVVLKKNQLTSHRTADGIDHYGAFVPGNFGGAHIKSTNILDYYAKWDNLLFIETGIKGRGRIVYTVH
jgi:hypothetical protein